MESSMRALIVVAVIGLAAWAPRSGKRVEVIQKDRKFDTTELTVSVGDTVVFHNEDGVVHNVFATAPGIAFDLKTQMPGSTSLVPFDKVGTGEVRCAIHPSMKLTLHVTP
jgi:plastocyanin